MSNFKEVTVKNVERLNDIIVSQASAIAELISELEIAEYNSKKYRDWWLEEGKKLKSANDEIDYMAANDEMDDMAASGDLPF
tara:strand:- start:779 stop:1024 length:246 start_codon:yes stop_codon:yes gene_type:complete